MEKGQFIREKLRKHAPYIAPLVVFGGLLFGVPIWLSAEAEKQKPAIAAAEIGVQQLLQDRGLTGLHKVYSVQPNPGQTGWAFGAGVIFIDMKSEVEDIAIAWEKNRYPEKSKEKPNIAIFRKNDFTKAEIDPDLKPGEIIVEFKIPPQDLIRRNLFTRWFDGAAVNEKSSMQEIVDVMGKIYPNVRFVTITTSSEDAAKFAKLGN